MNVKQIRRQVLSGYDFGNHSPAPLKRAHAAAEALVLFVDSSGRIPQAQFDKAARAANIATKKTWGNDRCRDLARQMRIAPITRQ